MSAFFISNNLNSVQKWLTALAIFVQKLSLIYEVLLG